MAAAEGILRNLFERLATRDRSAVLELFCEDATLFDPHYPNSQMTGRTEIGTGLDWGLKSIDSFGFKVRGIYVGEDGRSCAAEVDTHHVLKGGKEIAFPQMFVVEVRDDKISRLCAYQPNGPNGFIGLMLGLSHLFARLS